jgi:acyl-CoA thioesterase II
MRRVPADPLANLIDLLDLESVEDNIFRGRSQPGLLTRTFGGQVAGQALVAAGRTVPSDRPVHSLHAYFLRPGDAGASIVYLVDRIRDGRSFTTRRVVAVQHGEPIFNLSASFQWAEPGIEHQLDMPQAPSPESLPTWHERFAAHFEGPYGKWLQQPRPFDLRYVDDPPALAAPQGPRPARQQVWMRTNGTLSDDPLLHVCLATYASDLTLLDSVLLKHALAGWHSDVVGASLDHAMWFHRPFRADEWLLYHQRSQSASNARGIAEGSIFTSDGLLAVTVIQEGLMRPIRRHP